MLLASLLHLEKKKSQTNDMTENPHIAFIFNMLQLYKLIWVYFPREEKS